MPRPPTSDAKWCVEQLFQYMELSFKNRVQSKLGKQRTLEWGSLSNLGGNAAMAHAPKTRRPLSRASVAAALSVNVSSSTRYALREVFITYCSLGRSLQPGGGTGMSRFQWIRLVRDTELAVPPLTPADLELMWEKSLADLRKSDALASRLGLPQFLQLLAAVAVAIYGKEGDVQKSFESVAKHVQSHARCELKEPDPLLDALLSSDVMNLMSSKQTLLRPIFDHYVAGMEVMSPGCTTMSQASFKTARYTLAYDAFIHFCSDFGLVPDLLGKAVASRAYTSAYVTAHSNPKLLEEIDGLNFMEFTECLGRAALMAFNYQVPKEASFHMDFDGAYATHAKRLWLNDAEAQRELSLQEEIVIPPAMYEEPIGNEDRPHYDRSMTSKSMAMRRSASSVWGCLNGDAPTWSFGERGEDDEAAVQVLNLDDGTAPRQVQPKPVHLTSFTVDWVAQPSPQQTAPRPEHAPLPKWSQELGWYNVNEDVPPRYMEHAETMLQARIAREQVIEAATLQLSEERRQERKNALVTATQRREALQSKSGQVKTKHSLESRLPSIDGSGVMDLSSRNPTSKLPAHNSSSLFDELQAASDATRQFSKVLSSEPAHICLGMHTSSRQLVN